MADKLIRDSTTGIERIEIDGVSRGLGLIPSPMAGRQALPPFGESNPIIPISEWRKGLDRRPAIAILNQGNKGACNAFAGVGAFANSWRAAGGTSRNFSPWTMYASVNGGSDRGSSPTNLIEVMKDKGVALDEDNEDGAWITRKLPSDAWRSASRFKVEQVYALKPSIEEIGTACLLGHGVWFGMQLPRKFNDTDAEGIPPHGGYLGLHAMYANWIYWSSKRNKWHIDVPNSWGLEWGLGGHCRLDEDHLTLGYFEAYAIKAVSVDPEDMLNPPEFELNQ